MDSLAALHNLQVKVKGMTEVASSLKEDSGRRASAFNQFYEATIIKETMEPESGYTATTPVQMPAPQPDPSFQMASVLWYPIHGVVHAEMRPGPRHAKGKKLLIDMRCPRPSNACCLEKLIGFKVCHQ
jgi:hypothetical protein